MNGATSNTRNVQESLPANTHEGARSDRWLDLGTTSQQHREKPLAFAADLDEWDDAVAEYREKYPANDNQPAN